MMLRLGTVHLAVMMIAMTLPSASHAIASPRQTPDIEYGRADGASLKLDAYVPDGDGPFPVVVYVHGGGWGGGDKRADSQALDALKAANLVLFSIDYRLAPANRWPACFDDVNTAVRWAKANAAKFKGTPDRIALVGYSAGGQLSCLAAMKADAATAVQAVVALAPPTDFELDLKERNGLSKALQDLLDRPQPVTDDALNQLRDLGPIHHVRPGLPPFLILHGTADKTVPFDGSIAFQKAIRAAGGQCDLIPLPDAPHRLRDWRHADQDFARKMTDWITSRLTVAAPTTRTDDKSRP